MEATTKELRLKTRELLAATDRGESVVITYRGNRRAVLRGWDTQHAHMDSSRRNPAFGMWADKSGDVDDQVRRLRQRRSLP